MNTNTRILYIGNFRPSFSTETHVRLSLEELGCRVTPVQEDETSTSALTPLVREADFLMYTRTWGLRGPDPIGWMKAQQIPTVSFHLDLYAGLERGRDLRRDSFWQTKDIFSPDGGSDEVFRAQGINHHYLKAGVYGPECYRAEPADRLRADVSFVGSYDYHPEWPYRRCLVDFLRETYGPRFAKHGAPETCMRGHELNQLYASVKVVVGDSLCLGFDHCGYWSDRVYETLGRGGFLIHPYIFGMEEEFVDRQHIVYYPFGDFATLRRLIDYYLVHDDEREAIRAAGHARVKERCTYVHRMRELLTTVGRDQTVRLDGTNAPEAGPVRIRPATTDEIVVREIWQDNVYQVGPDDFRASGVAIDLGANIGAFTLYAAHCGAKRVIAYEPDEENHRTLLANLAERPEWGRRVEPVAAAIWRQAGWLDMQGVQAGARTIEAHDPSSPTPGTRRVRAIDLNELFERHAVTTCDVLKMDVEGAEYPILAGATPATLDRCRRIVLEFHDAPDEVFGLLLAKLTHTHKLSVLGSAERGGYIWAAHY